MKRLINEYTYGTMSPFRFCIFGILLLFCVHRTQAFDGCLCVEEIANGLRLPVSLVHANDGSNRIFVAELYGVVNIFYPNGTKLPEPFIDVSSRMGKLAKVSESGLTDIVFHPNFKSNRLFYMLISTPVTNKYVDHHSNLLEFKASATDENKADPSYSRLLLRFPQPFWAHNSNELLFGIDNYLYMFIGDGGYQNDPNMYAQNMDKLLGKVLRIDVDSRTGNLPYGIPPDNPFNNGSYKHPEIYALGLRNPWRAGMDAGDRETGQGRGRIVFGDVGQDRIEELDLIEKGANYGWNIYEGTSFLCRRCLKGPGKLTAPIFSYSRSTRLGKSVIGGQFYRGCRNPKLNGIYLWGDHYSGLLFRLKENKVTGTWENKEVEMCNSNICQHPLQSNYVHGIVSFGLDEEGEMYMLSAEGRNPYKKAGHVYRFVEPSQPGNPELCSVGASQTATENKPIFQNLPKPITSSKIPNNMESDTKAFKENQIVDINSASQAEAIKSTTHPTTTRTTTIPTTITEPTTTTLTTTPRSTTMTAAATTSSTTTVLTAKSKSVTSITLTTQTPTPTPTPTTTQPPKQSNLGTDGSSFPTNLQQESTALGNTDRAGSVDIDGTETIADAVVNGEATTSDPYSVGQSTISPTFSSDDDVETKVIYHIQDIFKKGNSNLKKTLAKLLGKLLSRLYYADFPGQGLDQEPLNPSDTPKQLDDEHSDPQVVNSANIATKLDAESSDDSETKPDKAD